MTRHSEIYWFAHRTGTRTLFGRQYSAVSHNNIPHPPSFSNSVASILLSLIDESFPSPWIWEIWLFICLFNHLSSQSTIHSLMHIYIVFSVPFVSWENGYYYQMPGSLLKMLTNLNIIISYMIGTIPILQMIFVRQMASSICPVPFRI